MKNYMIVVLVCVICLAACTPSGENGPSPVVTDAQPLQSSVQDQDETIDAGSPACYTDGIHPIGESIAEQFNAITTYEEVMGWFCDGALFEDILNALATEELSGVDADQILHLVAEGRSWNDIWLELGFTVD